MSSETIEQKAEWFYLEGEESRGPFTLEEIRTFLVAGKLSSDTHVCREGMNEWVTISSLPDFKTEPQKAISSSTKTDRSRKILIGAGVFLVIGVIAVSGWYYGIHEPKMRELAREEEQQRQRDLQEAKAKAAAEKREEQAAAAKKAEDERQRAMEERQRVQATETQIAEIAQRITIERTSLNSWLDYVQQVLATRNMTATINAAHVVAAVLGGATANFPDPLKGDRSKVDELLGYVQEKARSIDSANPTVIGYNAGKHVWVIHDRLGGCIFSPLDIDPSSAQVVSRVEQSDNGLIGQTLYYARFTTINNRKRVIVCNVGAGIPGINLIDHVDVFCGVGTGDQQAERIGTALAGIFLAYGGENEVINNTSLNSAGPGGP